MLSNNQEQSFVHLQDTGGLGQCNFNPFTLLLKFHFSDQKATSETINIKNQLTTFLQVNPPAALTDKQANNADKSGEKKVENVEEVLEPAVNT